MFDMGFTEMMLIGIVALVVIGPERLPGAARTAGKYFGKLKRFVTNVRADVESELRADELRDIVTKQQEQLNSLKDAVSEVGKDVNHNFSNWDDVLADSDARNSKPLPDENDNEPSAAVESETAATDAGQSTEDSSGPADSDTTEQNSKPKADAGP